MRPNLHQLYCNPELIISALVEAGVENAQAKVMRMMDNLIDYYSMDRYHARLNRDRLWSYQQLERMRIKKSNDSNTDTIRQHKKSIADADRILVVSRSYLKRVGKKIENKIAKWPDLSIDPSDLKEKPDKLFIKNVLTKRMKKNKPKTIVLG